MARFEFAERMEEIRDARAKSSGGHTWQKYTDRYGPGILFAEIASATSRIEQMVWPAPLDDLDHDRLEDLLCDLGNYAGFLYEWSLTERKKK